MQDHPDIVRLFSHPSEVYSAVTGEFAAVSQRDSVQPLTRHPSRIKPVSLLEERVRFITVDLCIAEVALLSTVASLASHDAAAASSTNVKPSLHSLLLYL